MTLAAVRAWEAEAPLSPLHVDCVTTVMLKILDGKCKMRGIERERMRLLYQVVRDRPGHHFGPSEHLLIRSAGSQPSPDWVERVYERRVLAETVLSRPVMKAFKALVRERGLYDAALGAASVDAPAPCAASTGATQAARQQAQLG